ncbi:hypothetical protein GCM10010399_81600 [Dactylosporangium fulvum]|uniref:Uncharacterized protein n=1 Tax=Dactylosporangium fulvum TaxID=53359 RepID=A0ABY5WE45_9ACTN|nr:hypothetical protein [Dactylosporangium fulvum]UWP87191.1 hypothetical protein Dfulv_24295 [Dactylosporangium fulvum]
MDQHAENYTEPLRDVAPGPAPGAAAETTAGAAAGGPAGTPADTAAQRPDDTAGEGPLWDPAKAEELRGRWHDVQTRFVDDPKGSLSSAKALIDEAVHGLEDGVRDREEAFGRSGARISDSTEGMRATIQQYHHLLDRLLSV